VAALVRPRSWTAADLFHPHPALVVLLAGIQDPGNAGTILRSGEAFGATGAMLLEGAVHPENSKLLRASAGSVFRLPHIHGLKYGEALETLRRHGTRLYAAVPRARRTLDDIDFTEPLALAIGSEGAGVPDPILVASEQVSIRDARRVESLNAAVAAGIFLHEAARRRRDLRPRT
jgi:TrmH family RNA methyltransferase